MRTPLSSVFLAALLALAGAQACAQTGEYRIPLSQLSVPVALSTSATALAFGDVPRTYSAGLRSVTLTNNTRTALSLTVRAEAPFSVSSSNCATLPSGASCTVTTALNTSTSGTYSRSLTVSTVLPGGIDYQVVVPQSARVDLPSVLYAGSYWVEGTSSSYPRGNGPGQYSSAGQAASAYYGPSCASGNYQSSWDGDWYAVYYPYKAGGGCDYTKPGYVHVLRY